MKKVIGIILLIVILTTGCNKQEETLEFTKEALNKSIENMKNLNSYESNLAIDIDLSLKDTELRTVLRNELNLKKNDNLVSILNKQTSSNFAEELSKNFYIEENDDSLVVYYKTNESENWSKSTQSELNLTLNYDFFNSLIETGNTQIITNDEGKYFLIEPTDEKELELTEEFHKNFFGTEEFTATAETSFKTKDLRVYLNNQNSYIEKILYETEVDIISVENTFHLKLKIEFDFSNYNQKLLIEVPDEAKAATIIEDKTYKISDIFSS